MRRREHQRGDAGFAHGVDVGLMRDRARGRPAAGQDNADRPTKFSTSCRPASSDSSVSCRPAATINGVSPSSPLGALTGAPASISAKAAFILFSTMARASGVAYPVCALKVSAMAGQELDGRDIVVHHGFEQGGHAIRVARIDFGAMIEKQFHEICILRLNRIDQRRLALIVRLVGIGALAEQEAGAIDRARGDRVAEFLVHIRAGMRARTRAASS